MDLKKLGRQVGQLQKQSKGRPGNRADTKSIKRNGKEFRKIFAGDDSLAEKAREAKEKLGDQDRARKDEAGQ